MSVDLFRFVEGDLSWTLTSADVDHSYGADSSGAEIYTSTSMGRTTAETRTEIAKSSIDVYLPIDHELSQRWVAGFLDTPVSLTVFDHDPEGDTNAIWKGRLSSMKPESSKMTLGFESIYTSLRRAGLRRQYQRTCPHLLYGRGCNLSADDFAINAIATAVSGTSVTVHLTSDTAQVDGYFSGGMMEAPDGSLRFILNHVGDVLTLARQSENLVEVFASDPGAATLRLFPGCDRDIATCDSKFGNLLNNGAFPYIPINNPFNGTPIV